MGPVSQESVPLYQDRVRRIDENMQVLRDKIEETEMLPGRTRASLLNSLTGSDGMPSPVIPTRAAVNVLELKPDNDLLRLKVMKDIVSKSLLIRRNNLNATLISRGLV